MVLVVVVFKDMHSCMEWILHADSSRFSITILWHLIINKIIDSNHNMDSTISTYPFIYISRIFIHDDTFIQSNISTFMKMLAANDLFKNKKKAQLNKKKIQRRKKKNQKKKLKLNWKNRTEQNIWLVLFSQVLHMHAFVCRLNGL